MKRFYLISGLCLVLLTAHAQQIATFDDVELQNDSYYNGADLAGGFFSGGLWFPNEYVADWQYWSGFSVSNMKDIATPGYGNQYSAITGGGADESENYAVVFFPGELMLEFEQPVNVSGFELTNSTYAYLSMRDGDPSGFSKKFGGEDGADPDFFKLLVWGTDASGKLTHTVEFFLADFRKEKPEEKCIVNSWEWIDLSSLGTVVSLHFDMESSDMGEYGMNTPAYFCMDNFTVSETATHSGWLAQREPEITVFPNPVKDNFFVELTDGLKNIKLTASTGKILFQQEILGGQTIQISTLKGMPGGIYFLTVQEGGKSYTRKVLKK